MLWSGSASHVESKRVRRGKLVDSALMLRTEVEQPVTWIARGASVARPVSNERCVYHQIMLGHQRVRM
jgi:hypothetical protein